VEKNNSLKAPAAVLQTDNISKSFGYRRILDGISLTLNAGEMTLLLGKNGSGKTTIMKIMAGLVRPSAGHILFRGQNISEVPDRLRRAIGVISHRIGFYGELTAAENLRFFGRLGKREELPQKVALAMEKTGLGRFADLPVKTFSSGMGKRLNIARLMVLEPDVLLLDEPYTGLDYDSTRFFNEFLRSFKTAGGAVLMITHQIETCFDLSDQIAILENREMRHCLSAADYGRDEIIQLYHNLTR